MIYHTYDISSYKIHGVKWFNVKCFWKLYFKYFWKPGIHLVRIGIMKEDIHKLRLQLFHPRYLNRVWNAIQWMEWVVRVPKPKQKPPGWEDTGSCRAVPLWCDIIYAIQVPLNLYQPYGEPTVTNYRVMFHNQFEPKHLYVVFSPLFSWLCPPTRTMSWH